MKNHIEEFKNGNKVLRIYHDQDPPDPREWDNLGTMVCVHRRYRLGDSETTKAEQEIILNAGSWENAEDELIAYYRENGDPIVAILPLYLYDHSGITMRTWSYGDIWDSGQVGFIFATESMVRKSFIIGDDDKLSAKIKDRVNQSLKDEVHVYDQYLTGDVYGYRVFDLEKCNACGHIDEAEVDSCWGFYGSNWQENGLLESAGNEWMSVMSSVSPA